MTMKQRFLTPCFRKSSFTRPFIVSNASFRHQNLPSHINFNTTSLFQHARHFHTNVPLFGQKVQFNLADIGEGITEVELMEWFVKEGQQIAKVQSDKATVDITSRYDGKISKLHYKTGDIAIVGEPLVEIELDDGAEHVPQQNAVSSQETQSSAKSTSAPTSCPLENRQANNDKVLSTPAVRRLAREHNLDLAEIQGSGKSGRVMKEDVLRFLGHIESKPQETTAQATTAGPSISIPSPSAQDRVEPIRGLKRTMVKTMNLSNQIPTLQLMDDVILDNLTALRSKLKPLADQQGVKLTYMPFFIKAASLAMKQYPIMNSRVNREETEITYLASHNIGVAMDTPAGLLVPNIKNCQDKSILEIAAELNRLQQLGKEGKLGPEELSGGTFSLSNIGAIGGTYATPLVNPPEVAIVALGKMRRIATFNDEDQVVPQTEMNISVSADHRIIDGATVGRFINAWKQYLETPDAFFLALK